MKEMFSVAVRREKEKKERNVFILFHVNFKWELYKSCNGFSFLYFIIYLDKFRKKKRKLLILYCDGKSLLFSQKKKKIQPTTTI